MAVRAPMRFGQQAPDTAPDGEERPERGIDAASPFASPRANRFVQAARTLTRLRRSASPRRERPEGRAPGGSARMRPFRRAAAADAEKATLQNAVTATDRQIDQLVYELYGLTPEEIALVEGA